MWEGEKSGERSERTTRQTPAASGRMRARGAPIRCAAAPRAADWLPLLRRSPAAFKCMPRWLFSARWPAYTKKHALNAAMASVLLVCYWSTKKKHASRVVLGY